MIYRHFKYEGWLYALAFLIALGIRLTGLGALPLNDSEAMPALQALHISQSETTPVGPHPFYILSTSVLFLLYGGGTNFLARLIPALVGSFLVLAPLLFDNRLRPRSSLLLAFFLALDPGLVTISRLAASPILAITLVAFTVGFYNKNKLAHAAVFAALALLSGPSLWFGLLGLGISLAIYQLFNRGGSRSSVDETPEAESDSAREEAMRSSFSNSKIESFKLTPSILILFAFTFFSAGTLFLTVPGGIGAVFASIPAFINNWATPSGTTQGIVLLSLALYQPFALLLSIVALIRGWANGVRRIVFLSLWLLVSLVFVILLPARQMADLTWTLIPLNALAAIEFARHFNIFPDERREVAGVAFLTLFIWVFAWFGLSSLIWYPSDSPEYRLRFWMLVAALALLLVSLVLIAAGWSLRTARFGAVWGLAIGLGVLGLGGALGATGLRGMDFPELWWPHAVPIQAELLRETVDQISEFGTGDDHHASVVILGLDSPALVWALREHPVKVVKALDVSNAPDFVITPFEMDPALIAAYRGQDFTWRQTPLWNLNAPASWLRWVILREMPQSGEVIILWARDDLFIDN
ncbi:MAG: hypothetical protein JNK32_12625 [Anaerolineales bacterium]|nr:hypothetical protein [Anaerolineales bacterium]